MRISAAKLLRFNRILTATALLLAGSTAGYAASTNPLFDYQSDAMTADFRSAYSGVSDATVNVDVPYGLDDDQKYDVYMPDSRSSAPIIVMIHGGEWSSGDKEDADVAAAKAGYWVAKGYIFVSINYRLLPEKDPLVQAADVALAIASVQKNASSWSADKSRIVLMGAGAGGHLAALLSSNPSLASDQGASTWAGAVVLETPALDVPAIMSSSHSAVYDTAFGSDSDYWEDSSPTDLITANGLPMMVVCSTESSSGTCSKAAAFSQTADNKGVNVSVVQESLSPSEVNSTLGASGSYTEKVNSFIQSIL